jgi:hypothetical protein
MGVRLVLEVDLLRLLEPAIAEETAVLIATAALQAQVARHGRQAGAHMPVRIASRPGEGSNSEAEMPADARREPTAEEPPPAEAPPAAPAESERQPLDAVEGRAVRGSERYVQIVPSLAEVIPGAPDHVSLGRRADFDLRYGLFFFGDQYDGGLPPTTIFYHKNLLGSIARRPAWENVRGYGLQQVFVRTLRTLAARELPIPPEVVQLAPARFGRYWAATAPRMRLFLQRDETVRRAPEDRPPGVAHVTNCRILLALRKDLPPIPPPVRFTSRAMTRYQVVVRTDEDAEPEMDADISLVFKGQDGRTTNKLRLHGRLTRDAFKPGMQGTCTIPATNVGEIESLEIHYDGKPVPWRPGTITVRHGNAFYDFKPDGEVSPDTPMLEVKATPSP